MSVQILVTNIVVIVVLFHRLLSFSTYDDLVLPYYHLNHKAPTET